MTKNLVATELWPQISNDSMDLMPMMTKAPTFFGFDGEVGEGCGRNWVEAVAGNSGHFFLHDPSGTASLGDRQSADGR